MFCYWGRHLTRATPSWYLGRVWSAFSHPWNSLWKQRSRSVSGSKDQYYSLLPSRGLLVGKTSLRHICVELPSAPHQLLLRTVKNSEWIKNHTSSSLSFSFKGLLWKSFPFLSWERSRDFWLYLWDVFPRNDNGSLMEIFFFFFKIDLLLL